MSLIKNKDTNNFYPVSIPEVGWNCDYLFSTHRGCSFSCNYCSSKRLNKRFKSMGDPAVSRRLKGEILTIKNDSIGIALFGGDYIKRKLPNSSICINPYCDMFALSEEDIALILEYCKWHIENIYDAELVNKCNFIFQSKDPAKYFAYLDFIPQGSWLGTTIETNAYPYKISNAPNPYNRYIQMTGLREKIDRGYLSGCKLFVTIEPIMIQSNNVLSLFHMINQIKPELIFIGCDTGKNNLPEPTKDELLELIEQLKQITHVHVKNNARRILGKEKVKGE